jgi:hypothetical protein
MVPLLELKLLVLAPLPFSVAWPILLPSPRVVTFLPPPVEASACAFALA